MRQPVLSTHPASYATRRIRAFGEHARLEIRPAVPLRRALVTIVPDGPTHPLPRAFVDHAVVLARSIAGNDAEIRTPALHASEAQSFSEAGFTLRSSLALLSFDFDLLPVSRLPITTAMAPKRFRRRDTAALLGVDLAAFGSGWEMDEHELTLAELATPITRTRLAVDAEETIVGFAITGRAGRRGYLQRLAVHPNFQGRGVGRSLIGDSLRWSRRHNVKRLVVNTHVANLGALNLYRSLGFVDNPVGLVLMELRPST